MIRIVDVGDGVMAVVVQRTVQIWISAQYTGFDDISQYVDSFRFG